MKRLPWLVLFPALLIAGQLVAQDSPKPSSVEVPDVVKGITARELGGHMKFLASDLMRGRDTASAEIRLAADTSPAGSPPPAPSPRAIRSKGTRRISRGSTRGRHPSLEGSSVALEFLAPVRGVSSLSRSAPT